MIQFSKSLEGNLEVQEMLRTVVGGANFAVLSVSLEEKYGKRISEDFFNGLKKSGYSRYVGGISFEENMYHYLDQFEEYINMNWKQKSIKRSSFNYKPGDLKKISSKRKKAF